MGPWERESYHHMSNAQFAERLTRASRETLLTILETLPAALFFLDDSGTIVGANASTQALAGAPPEEITGKPLAQTLWRSGSPASHEQFRAAIARASQGETVHFQDRIHPREGKDLDVEATITRHVDADHHRAYLVFAGIDITARARRQPHTGSTRPLKPNWCVKMAVAFLSSWEVSSSRTIRARLSALCWIIRPARNWNNAKMPLSVWPAMN
jgi:PAS domain S-box-containing protein